MQRLFKGAQVRNLEGGVPMVIDAVSEHLAICHWNVDGRIHSGVFSPQSLELYSAGQQTTLWPELSCACLAPCNARARPRTRRQAADIKRECGLHRTHLSLPLRS